MTLVEELTAAGLDPKIAEEISKHEKVSPILNNWREHGLRQNEFDRKMNSGKAEISAKQAELAEEKTRLENDRKRMDEQFRGALRERELTATQLASVRAKAKSIAETYGIPVDKELFEGVEAIPATQPPPAPVSAVPQEFNERIKTVEDLFRNQFEFNSQMLQISQEHAQLFPDKNLNFQELINEALAQRRTPREVWDDKFGATAKRTEMSAEAFRAEGRAAANAEWEKKVSEGAVNPLKMNVPMSPVMAIANKHVGTNDRSQRSAQAILNASNALASGKYSARPREQ